MRIDVLNSECACLITNDNEAIGYTNDEQGREKLAEATISDELFVQIMDQWGDNPLVVVPPIIQGDMKAAKLSEIREACKSAIYAGVDLESMHFSLTAEDQINIQNLALQAAGGAETVLYHGDGQLCEPFSATRILALAEAAERHKVYHTTYCNHLIMWVRQAEEAELKSIEYGAELPLDLAEHMQQLLKEARL